MKLDAFLARYLDGFKDAEAVRRCWHSWNGAGGMPAAWPDFVAHRQCIQQHGSDWVSQLDRLGDLANNLARFVLKK